MKRLILSLFTLLSLLATQPMLGQSASEIIRKSEEIRRGVKSSQGTMVMTLVRPSYTRTMTMKMYQQGDDYALITILDPARDKGSSTLKRASEVWSWNPKIERVVKLPPSMMNQSWMGSDFTNDDLVREISLVTDYTHTLLKDSTIAGRPCWKVELKPKANVGVVWGKVNLFVDKKDYLQMRVEYFDEDFVRVSILQGTEVKTLGGRPVVSKTEMIPLEKPGQKTIMEITAMQFDAAIPAEYFTTQYLQRIR